MRSLVLAAFALLGPVTAIAQQGPRGPGGPPTLPDHWMTLDSLAAAVALTGAQRANVAEPYAALNAVMREAAARRTEMRRQMQEMLGGRSPQDLTEAERAALRARGDSAREEFAGFQAEADMWHETIRNLLTVEQQPKFDALPRPVVFRAPGQRRAPPGS